MEEPECGEATLKVVFVLRECEPSAARFQLATCPPHLLPEVLALRGEPP
jgi:hypothetical protein